MKRRVLEINRGVGNGYVPIDITNQDNTGHRLFYVARKSRLSAVMAIRRLLQYAATEKIRPSHLARKLKDYYLDTDR